MLRLSILLSALVFSLGATAPLSALDPTLPVTAVVSPADASYHNSLASITGTAADDVLVSAVELKIVREADGYFWDGAAFVSAETWLSASFADPNWSYAVLPAWVNGSSYTVISRAQDGDTNYSETYSTSVFHFDTGVSSSGVVVPADGSSPVSFSGISGTAADAESSIAQVWVKLIRASDNMYWNGGTSQWTAAQSWNLATGTNNWSWPGPPQAALTVGGVYFAVANAKDQAGNDQVSELGASTFTYAGATVVVTPADIAPEDPLPAGKLALGIVKVSLYQGEGLLNDVPAPVPMLRLTLQTTPAGSPSTRLQSLQVKSSGTLSDADIKWMGLYADHKTIGILGQFDGEVVVGGQPTDILIASASYSGGAWDFTGLNVSDSTNSLITNSPRAFFLAVRVSTAAAAPRSFGLVVASSTFALEGSSFTVLSGNNFPIVTATSPVRNMPGALSVKGTDISAWWQPAALPVGQYGYAEAGTGRVGVLKLEAWTNGFLVRINSFRVKHEGTGVSTDVVHVRLFMDSIGGDPELGDGLFSPALDKEITSVVSPPVADGGDPQLFILSVQDPDLDTTLNWSTRTYFVAYELSAYAQAGMTHRARLENSGVWLQDGVVDFFSPIISSDFAVTAVDNQPPTAAILAPAHLAYLSSLPLLHGTAADNVAVASVTLSIFNLQAGQYWNGAAWGGAQTWLDASIWPSSWTYSNVPAWVSGSSYSVYALAVDTSSNFSATNSTATFYFDTVKPVSGVTTPANNSFPASVPAISGTASDNGSFPAQVWVKVKRISDNYHWNGSLTQWTVAEMWNLTADSATWTYSGLPEAQLSYGATYYAVSRAADLAGNVQVVEVAGSTFVYYGGTPPLAGCASEVSVKNSGTGDYTTIQDAIDALPKNLTGNACVVVTNDGSYGEEVTVQGFTNNGYRLIIMREPGGTSPQVSPPGAATAVFRIMNASVTVAGFEAIPSGPIPYGVYASSDNVIISSVSVVSAGSISAAGIRVAGRSEVSDSAVTTEFSHGIQLTGDLNLVARASASNNDASYAALYLSGSSSNTVINSGFSNLGGDAVRLLNGSNRNLVDLSTITADSTAMAFHADNSDWNTLTRSYVANPSGYGAFLGFGADNNNVSSSTILSNAAAYFAVKLDNVSDNALAYNAVSNPAGVALTVVFSSYTSVDHSTVTSAAAAYPAVFVDASYQTSLLNSVITGADAYFARASTGAWLAYSVLLATNSIGTGFHAESSVGVSSFRNDINSRGTGILLGPGVGGAVTLSSTTVKETLYGLKLDAPAAGASLFVSSLTFAYMAPGATAVEFLGGQHISTFSGVGFNSSSITVNVQALALAAGSRVTMRDYSGLRAGPLYENDPSGYVDWDGADIAAPTVAILVPVHNSVLSSLPEINGTAADNVAVASVAVSVLNLPLGQYWNGSAWGAATAWVDADLWPSSWTYTNVPAWVESSSYVVTAKAMDPAGNWSAVYSTNVFTYSLVPAGALSPALASGIGVSSITINWGSTFGAGTTYYVNLSSWAGAAPFVSSAAVFASPRSFTGLTPDTSYYGFVSTDAANSFIASGFGVTLASAPAWVDFSSVAYTSATLIWAAGANPAWTVYEFEISTSSNFGAFTSSGSGTGTSAIFTGLASWTQYYGRARAVNGAGFKSAYTEGLSSTLTQPLLPTGSVTGLAASVLSATTVSWSWNAGTVADADYFSFYDGASVFVGTIAFGATGAYERYGLTPNSPHMLRVRGRNTLGEGPLVNSATVYTLAAVPASPVFSAVGYSSATLGWASAGNSAGTVYEYEISESNVFSTFVSSGSGTALNRIFTGLLQGATYYGRVRAVNGDSLATAYVSPAGPAITPVLLPSGLVSGLAGSAVGVSSIVWTWNSGTVAAADGFALYNNPGVSVGTAAFAASAAYTQAGLGPNTANMLRVAGSNNKGVGPLAASATVYTLALVPAAPAVSQLVLSSAALTLGLNGNPAGTELQLWRSADNISFANVYEGALTSYSDPALAECSPFYYKARARNGAGVYTAFSPTLSFTTMASTPAAPGGFYAEALDGARIALAWEPSPSLFAAGYRLYYDNASGTVDYNTPLAVFTSTETSWTTPALAAGSTYKFALRAAGGCGSEEKNVSLLASAQAVGVLSGVRAAIKVPLAGKRVKGNSVTIVAEIILGQVSQVAQVRFQYTPSGAGAWTDIPAANINHPNPDLAAPYFVHLDADALGAGTYDLRAVATDIYSVADPAAPAITIVVDPVDFDTSESVSAGEQRKEQKINNTVTSTVQAADDTTSLVSKVVIPSGAVNDSTAALTLVNNPAAVPAPPSGADALNLAVKVNLSNGQSQLAAGKTAALTFSYKDDDNNGIVDGTLASVERLKVYTVPDSGGSWTQLATSVDRTNKTITGVTTHFSFFSVFAAPASGLSAIKIYPVPWQPGAGGRFDAAGVTFSNLPVTARIKIYTITGELVRLIEVTSADGGVKVWDGRNSEGHKAASGIYLAFIKSGSDERTLKVAVER